MHVYVHKNLAISMHFQFYKKVQLPQTVHLVIPKPNTHWLQVQGPKSIENKSSFMLRLIGGKEK